VARSYRFFITGFPGSAKHLYDVLGSEWGIAAPRGDGYSLSGPEEELRNFEPLTENIPFPSSDGLADDIEAGSCRSFRAIGDSRVRRFGCCPRLKRRPIASYFRDATLLEGDMTLSMGRKLVDLSVGVPLTSSVLTLACEAELKPFVRTAPVLFIPD
jgi:hypothetical protein